MPYPFKAIEPKWQSRWEREKTFATDTSSPGPKLYILDMFPYPSGAGLHVGHPEGYTATDILARFKRMRGFNVLHPMGWDAFGLPAERYAMKTNIHPRQTTEENIATFRRQIKMLGLSYDWDREVDTTDPGYYRWTQWIFLKVYDSWFDPRVRKARPIAELVREFEVGGSSGIPGSRAVHGRRVEGHDPQAEARHPRRLPAGLSWPRSRSTGAKSSGPCWRTKKSRNGRKRGTRSSAVPCASG